jgi:hypothetical protein
VKWTGQLDRLIELKNDVEPDSPDMQNSKLSSIFPGMKGFSQAMLFSDIVADGRNLLLVRKGQQTPVFSISPGGEVRATKLQVPGSYALFTLISAGNTWIGEYIFRPEDAPGIKYFTYSFDPVTGKALDGYSFPTPLGFGLACSDAMDFTFLKKETDDTLTLVKATSMRRPNRTIEPTEDIKKK